MLGNGSQRLNQFISTAGLSVGSHTLYVTADYWNNLVSESNEANNVKTFVFSVVDIT